MTKIDKSLAKLAKRQIEKIQVKKIKEKMGGITTDTAEIQRIIRKYFLKKKSVFHQTRKPQQIG